MPINTSSPKAIWESFKHGTFIEEGNYYQAPTAYNIQNLSLDMLTDTYNANKSLLHATLETAFYNWEEKRNVVHAIIDKVLELDPIALSPLLQRQSQQFEGSSNGGDSILHTLNDWWYSRKLAPKDRAIVQGIANHLIMLEPELESLVNGRDQLAVRETFDCPPPSAELTDFEGNTPKNSSTHAHKSSSPHSRAKKDPSNTTDRMAYRNHTGTHGKSYR